jgi:hypothetical protein
MKPTNIVIGLILLCFLLIGILIHNDYGLGWDENFQLNNNGEAVWNFLKTGDLNPYLNNGEKYHGPAFELVLVFFQKLFRLNDLREIFFARHLITYIYFWLSGIAFWLLLKFHFRATFVVIIGVLWYFLMPRIFADAFYNSKDLAFLSTYTFCIFFLHQLLKNVNYRNAAIFGAATGFLVAIRITGLVVPFICFLLFCFKFLSKKTNRKKYFQVLFVYLISSIACIILFWPILWDGPVTHLVAAWSEMSTYSWSNKIRFFDSYIISTNLPWYYILTWIGITTPIMYLIFFLFGLVFFIRQLFVNKYSLLFHPTTTSVLIFIITIVSIISLNSVLYDGWRHIYFLYVALLIVSLYGVESISTLLVNGRLNLAFKAVILFFTFSVAFTMIKLHPYQNVYFNNISGVDNGKGRFKYEMDYWGLSYRQALEKLLISKNDSILKIHVHNPPGETNALILLPSQKRRIKYVTLDSADYFITNYRWCDREFTEYNMIDSITANGIVINGTFDLR